MVRSPAGEPGGASVNGPFDAERMLDGAWLHLREAPGPENVPLLVLVDSLGCDLWIWEALIGPLPGVARLLRYDRRGHGLPNGGAWHSPSSIDDHAADLIALVANPGTIALMRTMLVRQSVDGYLGSVAAVRDADLTGRVRAIAVPTLCLTGAEDASTPPAELRRLAAVIPEASYAEIPQAGHLPCLENPVVMTAQIATFLHGLGSFWARGGLASNGSHA